MGRRDGRRGLDGRCSIRTPPIASLCSMGSIALGTNVAIRLAWDGGAWDKTGRSSPGSCCDRKYVAPRDAQDPSGHLYVMSYPTIVE